MSFVMGLLMSLAKRILRDEIEKLHSTIDNAVFVSRLKQDRIEGAEMQIESYQSQIKDLIEENQRLTNDLSESLVAQNQAYESKRASEKREEDQRAINLELKLRLKRIRELLG